MSIITEELSEHLRNNVKYNNIDLSDIGNEIGFIIGKHIDSNKIGFELDDFIRGLKHGISIANGTHP